MMNVLIAHYLRLTDWVNQAQDGLNLVFRLYLAKLFFMAGMTKVQTWDSTLMLFEYEYNVPVIPFDLAAFLATGAELILPVLLVLGLGTRIGAAGLFILNYVAAISYPEISPAGINDHYFWASMLLVLVFYGPGRVSLDHWLRKRFSRNLANAEL